MFEFIAGVAVGLVVGWIFLPAPKVVTDWWGGHKPPPTLGGS